MMYDRYYDAWRLVGGAIGGMVYCNAWLGILHIRQRRLVGRSHRMDGVL
jgi:hypothetical protein